MLSRIGNLFIPFYRPRERENQGRLLMELSVSRLIDIDDHLAQSEYFEIVERAKALFGQKSAKIMEADPTLSRQSIAYACADYAITRFCFQYPNSFTSEQQFRKQCGWQEATRQKVEREPRTIAMNLYPIYFNLIRGGSKTIEGRAHKPDSHKMYPDIRTGDHINFTVMARGSEYTKEFEQFSVTPDETMIKTVKNVGHAPFVQWLFHSMYPPAGELFQPDVVFGYDQVATALHNAARYYAIPGYVDLIAKNGFIGIELEASQTQWPEF